MGHVTPTTHRLRVICYPYGLDIAYLYAKFDHCSYSFSRSRDMVGAHQNCSRDLTTPFQERFVICGLALAVINLSTKFEVSNSTHYENTKGDTNSAKWGGLG